MTIGLISDTHGHGELVEQGSHADLLSAGGDYADLWYAQADDRPASADD